MYNVADSLPTAEFSVVFLNLLNLLLHAGSLSSSSGKGILNLCLVDI